MSETFIPNSFQVPNNYCDLFMAYLTSDEWKCLTYATRRIFGFQKRQDRISLSQFADGITLRDGRILDRGTGLTLASTRKAVDGLVEARLLLKLEEAKPDRTPALYALQLDPDLVNLAWLENRREKRKATNRKRINKARANIKEPVDIAAAINTEEEQVHGVDPFTEEDNGYTPQHPYGYAPQTATGTPDSMYNNQGKKEENNNTSPEKIEPVEQPIINILLEEEKTKALDMVKGCKLEGKVSEEAFQYFVNAYLSPTIGSVKTLAYLEWQAEQGHSWEYALNIAKSNNFLENRYEVTEPKKPKKSKGLNLANAAPAPEYYDQPVLLADFHPTTGEQLMDSVRRPKPDVHPADWQCAIVLSSESENAVDVYTRIQAERNGTTRELELEKLPNVYRYGRESIPCGATIKESKAYGLEETVWLAGKEIGLISFKGIYEPYADEPKKKRELDLRN